MNVWQPQPGETLLARAPVAFATGAAPRVKGMRWFRDTDRRDIQNDLPGWPEGPVHTARSTADSALRSTVRATGMTLGVAVMAILSAVGGNVSGTGTSDGGSDTPGDREDEVADFPVVWASPGTTARTLPWQLDPGRSDERRYRTHAIVTDQRLVIVGFPFHKRELQRIEDEILWELPRSEISRVELKDFKTGNDFTITFADGSWCRLSSIRRRRLVRYLLPTELIRRDALTTAQQLAVDGYTARVRPPTGVSPVISRPPGGHFRVEFLLPQRLDAYFGASETSTLIDADGRQVQPEDYSPEDL